MRTLITGARGLVGRGLASGYRDSGQVFAMAHSDLDITSRSAVDETLTSVRPDLIFNCAVIGVDDCEKDPSLSRRVNVDGPRWLAAAAARHRAVFVHFSTNYVFSGDRTDGSFYDVDDPAHPINVYGSHKLEGEQCALEEFGDALIVRTSWVFGEGKDSFLATVPSKLAEGTPVSAIEDVFASATWVVDLVRRVAELVERRASGIFHVTNEGVLSYADFAEEAGIMLGLDPDRRVELIERTSESAARRLAARPRWTPMRCSRTAELGLPPLRPWQAALGEYVGGVVRSQ